MPGRSVIATRNRDHRSRSRNNTTFRNASAPRRNANSSPIGHAGFLPILNWSCDDPEHWVSSRNFDFATGPVTWKRSFPQFSFQMRPFEEKLTARLDELASAFADRNFCEVKFVTAALGFIGNFRKITANSADRRSCCLKTSKLRMTSVASGPAKQDFLSQQPFPPGREQAFGVKILGMNRPQPHRPDQRYSFGNGYCELSCCQ